MFEKVLLLPLAQLNTSSGGAGSAPATAAGGGAATVERPVATGAATTGTAGTGPAGTSPTTTATGTATAPDDGKPAAGGGGGFGFAQVVPIILMFVVVYFFLFRGQRKDEKKRKAMIAELKKGDRVMTIGGMLARVVSVDGDEVVLKIDESANVKAVYRKSAIQEVIDRDEKK